jgi:hypothetical protein
MLKLLGFILLVLAACTFNDTRVATYNSITARADKLIFYNNVADSFIAYKTVDAAEPLQDMKNILERNIKPVSEEKFVANYKIEFYTLNHLEGVLLISHSKENPLAKFISVPSEFCFKLPYGIGMSL